MWGVYFEKKGAQNITILTDTKKLIIIFRSQDIIELD